MVILGVQPAVVQAIVYLADMPLRTLQLDLLAQTALRVRLVSSMKYLELQTSRSASIASRAGMLQSRGVMKAPTVLRVTLAVMAFLAAAQASAQVIVLLVGTPLDWLRPAQLHRIVSLVIPVDMDLVAAAPAGVLVNVQLADTPLHQQLQARRSCIA
jgi:hypothetical protein